MTGFIVEGPSDEKAIYEIAKKLPVRTERKLIRVMDGNKLNKAKRYALDLMYLGCRKVILLKDSKGAPSKVKDRFLSMGFETVVSLHLVVKEIESWFLADEEALGDYLRTRIKAVSEPERIDQPKEYLGQIFKESRREAYFEGGKDPAEIARRLNLRRVESKCPSFKEFRQKIKN